MTASALRGISAAFVVAAFSAFVQTASGQRAADPARSAGSASIGRAEGSEAIVPFKIQVPTPC
jgi:hypothetical protein